MLPSRLFPRFGRLLLAGALAAPVLRAGAEGETDLLPPDRQHFTRIQIFLDAADFAPGRLDGRWGEFTRKAAARYLEAQGQPIPELGDQPPADLALPLDESTPILIGYPVTAEDVSSIGEVPDTAEEQAKLKAMPYSSVLERVAERYHADPEFIKELNPGVNLDDLQAGTVLQVPNVRPPFDIAAVAQRADSENGTDKKEDSEKKPETAAAEDKSALRLEISVAEEMLEVRQGDKLRAAFPITPGSDSLPAPRGEWKIESITWMPWFRYDEKMLNEGERGDEAHNVPPGPNNAVGIAWMALNKKGIGIHGTNSPDTIGRSASHGCIRLANWDAWKLGNMIPAGTSVTIQ